jgi:hypothetical protein
MVPDKIAIKGPQGKDAAGRQGWPMPEPQEMYEEEGGRPDVVDGNFVQDPFELKADAQDHTPNHTKGPKESKIGWNFQAGRGNGGVGL